MDQGATVTFIRALGLWLAAALAVGAFAATSAFAGPPEIGRCVKVAAGPGKYKDAGCEKGVVAKGGKYEWIPGVVKPNFTSEEATSRFETVGKFKVVCTSAEDNGRYLPPKNDEEQIVFKGCTATGTINKVKFKAPCENQGPGIITTQVLSSVLGFIKAPTEVGVSLENPTGGLFASFVCGGREMFIEGSVIGKVTPISKMTGTFKEKFAATVGLQKPESFEAQPKDTLTCEFNGTLEQCGFISTDTVTNEELLEINEVL